MKHCIANFKREIPSIDGMQYVVSLDHYSIFSMTEAAWEQFPKDQVSYEEITELEATEAWKYYGDIRGYRSAYSDVEGLEPDPESLAAGKRKTKVYITPEIEAAVILLMKRIFKKNVQDEFDTRTSREGEEAILNTIDGLSTIRELNYKKEEYLGTEMPKAQLQELFLWDNDSDSRIGRHHFIPSF